MWSRRVLSAPRTSTVIATGLILFGIGATYEVCRVVVGKLMLLISLLLVLWPTLMLTMTVLGCIYLLCISLGPLIVIMRTLVLLMRCVRLVAK